MKRMRLSATLRSAKSTISLGRKPLKKEWAAMVAVAVTTFSICLAWVAEEVVGLVSVVLTMLFTA